MLGYFVVLLHGGFVIGFVVDVDVVHLAIACVPTDGCFANVAVVLLLSFVTLAVVLNAASAGSYCQL